MTRPRGRPPLDPTGHPSAAVHLKLVTMDFDRAAYLARVRRTSIQAVIRAGLARLLHDEFRNLKSTARG
jgi:hypothetical protein